MDDFDSSHPYTNEAPRSGARGGQLAATDGIDASKEGTAHPKIDRLHTHFRLDDFDSPVCGGASCGFAGAVEDKQ
jgi:hypothetical protein